MSAAVWERKEEARKAMKTAEGRPGSGKQTHLKTQVRNYLIRVVEHADLEYDPETVEQTTNLLMNTDPVIEFAGEVLDEDVRRYIVGARIQQLIQNESFFYELVSGDAVEQNDLRMPTGTLCRLTTCFDQEHRR